MNQAYIELLERQAHRGIGLLPDRAEDAERKQRDFERRQMLAQKFGEWISRRLGQWDWFINPISFRDRHPDLERNPKTGEARHFRCIGSYGRVRIYVADPQLKSWKPDFHGRCGPKPPVPDKALAEIMDFLAALQEEAGQPIRWMIAEEFGRIAGRHHCHLLVGGVAHLSRTDAWKKAFEKFGRTRIEPFDPERGGAFYAGKYAAKQLGAIHFGGDFSGKYSARLIPGHPVGRRDVVTSAEVRREKFNRTDCFPRGFLSWRRKR